MAHFRSSSGCSVGRNFVAVLDSEKGVAMKIMCMQSTMQELAKATHKWCMYISFAWDDERLTFIGHGHPAAPYLTGLNNQNIADVISDGRGILMFDTKEGMEEYFAMTVGDDGPTTANPYAGSHKVYAVTCGPDGEFITENT